MLFFILLAWALPTYSLTVLPLISTAISAPPDTITVVPPSRYHLKTCVVGGGHADKEGLYASGFHIGAGINDVTLEGIEVASIGFLNGTYQQFDYGTPFPWGLNMGGADNYAAWEFALVDTGFGSEGFFFNSSGLQWTETEGGFSGWLACDWWHGAPQLFWKYYFYDYPIPSSCVQVNLMPVAVWEGSEATDCMV
ncbi:hypothetical protein N7G274_005634 [Stereocaulon virgatum]|uniref:DUF7907 domain-containing protein n=1 Tax=Stereocaulon virgatum TaxID=373712 RepID=A0ABR4A7G2_9LECA